MVGYLRTKTKSGRPKYYYYQVNKTSKKKTRISKAKYQQAIGNVKTGGQTETSTRPKASKQTMKTIPPGDRRLLKVRLILPLVNNNHRFLAPDTRLITLLDQLTEQLVVDFREHIIDIHRPWRLVKANGPDFTLKELMTLQGSLVDVSAANNWLLWQGHLVLVTTKPSTSTGIAHIPVAEVLPNVTINDLRSTIAEVVGRSLHLGKK